MKIALQSSERRLNDERNERRKTAWGGEARKNGENEKRERERERERERDSRGKKRRRRYVSVHSVFRVFHSVKAPAGQRSFRNSRPGIPQLETNQLETECRMENSNGQPLPAGIERANCIENDTATDVSGDRSRVVVVNHSSKRDLSALETILSQL